MIINFPIQNIQSAQESRYISARMAEIQKEAQDLATELKDLEVQAFIKATRYYELSTEGLFLATRIYDEQPSAFPFIQLELPYVYS